MKKAGFIARVHRWSGLLGVVIGVIALIVGTLLGVWSVQKGEELAVRSGGLSRPDVALDVGNWPIQPNERESLVIGAPFAANSLTLMELPFVVANDGDKTAQDVTVMIKLPQEIRRGLAEVLPRTVQRIDPGLAMTESRANVGEFEFQSYNYSRLHPEAAAGISEVIIFEQPTTYSRRLQTRKATIHVRYEYVVEVTIDQSDESPREYDVSVSAVRAANMSELERAVGVQIELQRDITRSHATFAEYLATRISGRTAHCFAIQMQVVGSKTGSGKTLTIGKTGTRGCASS